MNSIKLHFLGLNGIFLWLSNYTRWCKDFQNYPTEKRYHILEKSKWSDSICYNLDMRPPFGYWLIFFKHVQQGLETHFLGSRKKLVRSKSWNLFNKIEMFGQLLFLHQNRAKNWYFLIAAIQFHSKLCRKNALLWFQFDQTI